MNSGGFTSRRQLTFKNLVLFLLSRPRTALQNKLDQFYRVLNHASAESQVVTMQAFSNRSTASDYARRGAGYAYSLWMVLVGGESEEW